MFVSDINRAPVPAARLRPPTLLRLAEHANVLSAIAQLIASEKATTKPELATNTGLARSTINNALAQLQRSGLVRVDGLGPTTGRGRPAEKLAINLQAGVVLVLDLTPHHVRTALVRMDQEVVAIQRNEFSLAAGPAETLAFCVRQSRKLLSEVGLDDAAVRVVIASVPGPVDTKRGMPVRPPIMPGWDRYPVAAALSAEFNADCLVENDVNVMALGEARVLPADQCPLLLIKVGTGIGGGMVTADGSLHRGSDGAACDIGHLPVRSAEETICSCGNIGCIEAVASAEAITRKFREATNQPDLSQNDLRIAAKTGDPVAIRLIRDAAAELGQIVAALVHVFNPARIVLAGSLTAVTDDLLAGIRAVAYQQALPLATRNLTLAHSTIGELGVVVGASVLGIEHTLSPAAFAKHNTRL